MKAICKQNGVKLTASIPNHANRMQTKKITRPRGLDKREMFGDQTPSNIVLVNKHFTIWTPCLVLFDRV